MTFHDWFLPINAALAVVILLMTGYRRTTIYFEPATFRAYPRLPTESPTGLRWWKSVCLAFYYFNGGWHGTFLAVPITVLTWTGYRFRTGLTARSFDRNSLKRAR